MHHGKRRLSVAAVSPRLGLAADALPRAGHALLLGPPADLDLGPFGDAEITILHDMMPAAAQWSSRGYDVVQEVPSARFDAAVVFLPRSRQSAQDRVARAASVASRVLVDGQKTDGIDAMLKAVRARVAVAGSLSKAHGKIFWFDAEGDSFADWRAEAARLDRRWHVVPGVFSADGVDPGSALLAKGLPERLGARVADLGAGWGYLAAAALARCTGLTELHLVEAQASALACARRNVADPRARFHWADATCWAGARDLDAVIMNPPFHTGRDADTGLGRDFVAAAARLLRPGGMLWMVANRHLAYEQALRAGFADVTEIGGDNRYKLLRGTAMPRKRR